MSSISKTKQDRLIKLLYEDYYSKLAAYASFYLKNDETHDVVQEVFLNLLERLDDGFDEISLNAYLYKAVHNKCVDFIRHKEMNRQHLSIMKKKKLEMEWDFYCVFRNEVVDTMVSQELQERIDNEIETLSPKRKEVFRLHFKDQWTVKEISSMLGISRSTVENHIYSCTKVLREKLAKYISAACICCEYIL